MGWRVRKLLGFAVVSGTKMLAADLLRPISCEVYPPWIGFDSLAHHTVVQLD